MWQPLARPRSRSQHATPMAAVCYINETEHMQNYQIEETFVEIKLQPIPCAPLPVQLPWQPAADI